MEARSATLEARRAALAATSNKRSRALLSRTFAAWHTLASASEHSAYLSLSRVSDVDGAPEVLVRRVAENSWVLPSVDAIPVGDRRAAERYLALVVNQSCERADRVCDALTSPSLSRFATRRAWRTRATVAVVPMRGKPLAMNGEVWVWMKADDVPRSCKLDTAAGLAFWDAVRVWHLSPRDLAASYGLAHTQLGSVRQPGVHLHLLGPPTPRGVASARSQAGLPSCRRGACCVTP
mgnify:FL=1